MFTAFHNQSPPIIMVKHDKTLFLLAPYILVPILFENNICILDTLRILVCDMVAMPGMLIKFHSFKEVRQK